MSLTFTILGCGSSGGVPRPGTGWGACDPANPKNRRRRCALLVERRGATGVTRILIDTGPDLREQLLDANVDWLDAVLYTHEHADTHTHRRFARPLSARAPAHPVYADDPTSRMLMTRFSYCFVQPPGSDYPPILTMHGITPGVPLTIDGKGGPVTALPFVQDHGDIKSLGFRFGGVAYSGDLHDMRPRASRRFPDLDLWIVDALPIHSASAHFSVADGALMDRAP